MRYVRRSVAVVRSAVIVVAARGTRSLVASCVAAAEVVHVYAPIVGPRGNAAIRKTSAVDATCKDSGARHCQEYLPTDFVPVLVFDDDRVKWLGHVVTAEVSNTRQMSISDHPQREHITRHTE